MLLASRRRRGGPDIWLPLKLALFVVAAAAAVTGMALGQDWLITAAIVLLGAGFLLRFVRPKDAGPPPDGPPPDTP